MDEIKRSDVVAAIAGFLSDQLAKKLEPEQKEFEKLKSNGSEPARLQVLERISNLQQKYELDTWMQDAATRMANQLRFGTHISKGVHPDSKGDNVNFHNGTVLPEGIVGSQTLNAVPLDANGNAAALPLASFFDIRVNEDRGTKIRDLLRAEHSTLSGVFNSNLDLSNEYAKSFKRALDNPIEQASTDGLNKQILWPLSNAIDENNYMTLVPLFPSALSSVMHKRINSSRFGEENRQAKENRYKKSQQQESYISIRDLAVQRLGGTKPQNVSQLTSKQGGRNYLLPSLPPKITRSRSFTILNSHESFFTDRLRWHCRVGLEMLFAAIADEKNTKPERDIRREAMNVILQQIIVLASDIQKTKPPGWTKDASISKSEKYWLDPWRGQLAEESDFEESRLSSDWTLDISNLFALWINKQLQKEFKKIAKDFADPEHAEWRREIEKTIRASQRKNEGVFL